jgi:predicted Zn finger-like uncharacterized protein
MNVNCPNCATVYRVDPAKVPEGGVRARCSICSAVFAVRRDGEAPDRPTASVASAPAAMPAPAPSPPPPAPAPTATPPRSAPLPAAGAPRAEPVAPPSPLPPPAAAPAPATSRPMYPPPAVPAASPRPAPPAAPFAPPASQPPAPTSAPAPPAFARPAAAQSPAAPPSPAPAGSPRPAGGRPVNPFLSQDPALKARRLARALISDMVVYHPAKRQDGLRDGNLKELFEDEIRKSWEEYAEQVGKDVADGTPYFKEALNEILAGGRQIF